MSSEQLIELAAEIQRLKLRVARLEHDQVILVVTSSELNSLAEKSARSHADCLYALREANGSMKDAAAYLQVMPADSGLSATTH